MDGHAWKTRGGSYQREDTVNLEVLSTAAHRPRELGFAAATSLHEDSSAAVAETGIATAAAAAPPPLVERKVNLLGQYAHHASSRHFHRRTYHLGRSGGAAAAAAAAVAAVACVGPAAESAAANAAKRRVEDLHVVHYLEDRASSPSPLAFAAWPSSSPGEHGNGSSAYGAAAEAASAAALWGHDVSALVDLLAESMVEDDFSGYTCGAQLGAEELGDSPFGDTGGAGGDSGDTPGGHRSWGAAPPTGDACRVLDLAPDCCDAAGGAKLLLVLSQPLSEAQARALGGFERPGDEWALLVGFRALQPVPAGPTPAGGSLGDGLFGPQKASRGGSCSGEGWTWVAAAAVGLAAVRCAAPPMRPGPAQVAVALQARPRQCDIGGSSSSSSSSSSAAPLRVLTAAQKPGDATAACLTFRRTGAACLQLAPFMSADWALGTSSASGSTSSSPLAELKRASSGCPTSFPPDQKHTRGSAHCVSSEEPMPPPSLVEIASILSQMQFPAMQRGGAQGGDLRSPSSIDAPAVASHRTAKDDIVVATASSSLSTEGPKLPQPAITTAANDPATRFLEGNWRPLPQPPHSAGQLAAEAALLGGPQVARFAGGSTSLGQPAHEPGHLGSAQEQHMVDIEWQFRQQVAAQQLRQALQVQMQQQQQSQSQLIPPGPAPMPLYPAPQSVHAQGQMHNFWQPSLGLPLGAASAESVRTFYLFTMSILVIHFFSSSLSLFLHYFLNLTHTPVRITNNIVQVSMQYSRINETYERIFALQGQLAGIGGIGGGGGRMNL